MAASTANYTVSKGIVSWKPEGAPNYRDLGNAPALSITPEIEFLEHFSSRAGIKSKDLEVPVQVAGKVSLTLDEFTIDNIALAILGQVSDQTSGDPGFIASLGPGETQRRRVQIMSESTIIGALRYVGTNTVGKRVQVDLPRVAFKGGSALQLISDEWNQFELTGEILLDTAQTNNIGFGRIYEIA
jgi:hypothetical protein